jgi:hypothetical protein
MASNDEDYSILLSAMLLFSQAVLLWSQRETRAPSMFAQRIIWNQIVEKHSECTAFKRHLQMSLESFNKLLTYIRPSLLIDERMAWLQGGPILLELHLYCTLRWLAGGSYSDINMYAGISKSSFYRVCWHTIFAIYDCPELQLHFPQTLEECRDAASGFTSISRDEAIVNCVRAIDGYLLHIEAPPKSVVGNMQSYFSGHYQ